MKKRGKLTGLIYMVVIFMDDDESSWTTKETKDYYTDQIIPNCNFIEHQARKYDQKVYLISKLFQSNEKVHLKYKGKFDDNYYKRIDALEQVANCLGYKNKNEFDAHIKEEVKGNQVIYMVILNKKGSSVAYCDSVRRKEDFIQHCICRNNYTNGSDKRFMGSFAHEILHLFGAEDYYKPEKIKQLATQLCPNDIMLQTHNYIAMNEINEYTAYCIGWLEKYPEQYKHADWFK